jgi:hypothetical protein
VECCLNPKWFNYFWASPWYKGNDLLLTDTEIA